MGRILVVEDDATSQLIFQDALTRMGHEVVLCADGRDALCLVLDQRCFDVLVVDVMLPGLDGRDLVRRIRTHTCLADVPVIITSGVVGPRAIGDLLDMGNTLFLSKPVDVPQLGDYVRQCLARRRQTVGHRFCEGMRSLAEPVSPAGTSPRWTEPLRADNG